MRDPRRCAPGLLLHAVASGGPRAARPRRARRAGDARGQPRALRGPQDQVGALPGRHNRQPQAHLQDNAGERPEQCIWLHEVQMPCSAGPTRSTCRTWSPGARRARALHPCMQRPDLRARQRRLELRLPARRPEQPRDRRPFRRTAAASSTTRRLTRFSTSSASSGRCRGRGARTTTRSTSRPTRY